MMKPSIESPYSSMTSTLYTSALRELPYFDEFARITGEGIQRAKEVLHPLQEPDRCDDPYSYLDSVLTSQADLYFQVDALAILLNDNVTSNDDPYQTGAIGNHDRLVDEMKLMDSFITLQNEAEKEAYDALLKTKNVAKLKIHSSAVENELRNWNKINLHALEVIVDSPLFVNTGGDSKMQYIVYRANQGCKKKIHSCMPRIFSTSELQNHAMKSYLSSDRYSDSVVLSYSCICRLYHKRYVDSIGTNTYRDVLQSSKPNKEKRTRGDNAFVLFIKSGQPVHYILSIKSSQESMERITCRLLNNLTETDKNGSLFDLSSRYFILHIYEDCSSPRVSILETVSQFVNTISTVHLLVKEPSQHPNAIKYDGIYALDLTETFRRYSNCLERYSSGLIDRYSAIPEFGGNGVFPRNAIGVTHDEQNMTQLYLNETLPRPMAHNGLLKSMSRFFVDFSSKHPLGYLKKTIFRGTDNAPVSNKVESSKIFSGSTIDDTLSSSLEKAHGKTRPTWQILIRNITKESENDALFVMSDLHRKSSTTREVVTPLHYSRKAPVMRLVRSPTSSLKNNGIRRAHSSNIHKFDTESTLDDLLFKRRDKLSVSHPINKNNIDFFRLCKLQDRPVSYTNVISGIISLQKYTRFLFTKMKSMTNALILSAVHVSSCQSIQKQYRRWKLRMKLKQLRTNNFGYSDKDFDIDLDDMFDPINDLIIEDKYEQLYVSLNSHQHPSDDKRESNDSDESENAGDTSRQNLLESRTQKVGINEIMDDWNVTNVTLAKVRFQNELTQNLRNI